MLELKRQIQELRDENKFKAEKMSQLQRNKTEEKWKFQNTIAELKAKLDSKEKQFVSKSCNFFKIVACCPQSISQINKTIPRSYSNLYTALCDFLPLNFFFVHL